jgi:hypothetical protein
MTCDRTLNALATGGPFARWRATRHLARCPACSAEAEEQRRIIEALADAPPLTESQRRSWMRAADEATPAILAHRHPAGRRLAIAASILGLLSFGAWLAMRPSGPTTSPLVAVTDPSTVKLATLRDLDALQADVTSLTRELDGLLQEVELLDARREVDALQIRLASHGGRGGS